jgi:hypothetical protein
VSDRAAPVSEKRKLSKAIICSVEDRTTHARRVSVTMKAVERLFQQDELFGTSLNKQAEVGYKRSFDAR